MDHRGRLIFHGGMEDLGRFHLSIVRGERWPQAESGWAAGAGTHAGAGKFYSSAMRMQASRRGVEKLKARAKQHAARGGRLA